MTREGKGPIDPQEVTDTTLSDKERDPEYLFDVDGIPVIRVLFENVEQFKRHLEKQKKNLAESADVTLADYGGPYDDGLSDTGFHQVKIEDYLRRVHLEVIEMQFDGINLIINFLQSVNSNDLSKYQELIINIVNLKNTYAGYYAYLGVPNKQREYQLDQLLGYSILQVQDSLMKYLMGKGFDMSKYAVVISGEEVVKNSIERILEITQKFLHDQNLAEEINIICRKVSIFFELNQIFGDTEF